MVRYVDSLVTVARPALYQGTIPVKEYGFRCVLCRQEWWPSTVGGNRPLHPQHIHYRHTTCRLVSLVNPPRRSDGWDV